MSRRRTAIGLLLAALAQALVLVGLYAYSRYPLWVGREVRLAVADHSAARAGAAPVDLAIATLPVPDSGVPRVGRDVYVSLHPDGAVWKAGKVGYRPPERGLYLSGKIVAVHFDDIRVRYGIEAEDGGKSPPAGARVAVVKVAPDGRAALLAVRPARP